MVIRTSKTRTSGAFTVTRTGQAKTLAIQLSLRESHQKEQRVIFSRPKPSICAKVKLKALKTVIQLSVVHTLQSPTDVNSLKDISGIRKTAVYNESTMTILLRPYHMA